MTKKILVLVLAAIMVASLFACTNANKPANTNNQSNPSSTANNSQSGEEGGNNSGENGQSGKSDLQPAKLTGKMTIIEGDDRDASILRGVTINGNRVGSNLDINGKEASLTDVRCVFELSEWVSFYPDTDAEYYLRVWVLKHRDDQDYYKDCKFSDLMPNFAAYCDLHYPVDAEDPENSEWGSFYLNPDDNEAGYYDFVFTYEGKAIAVLQTRFYKMDSIAGLSGADLIALMHE